VIDHQKYQQVARIHINGLDQGFLATLGENFLVLLYRSIDECTESVLFVELEDETSQVQGFVTGSTGMRPIYRQMLKHPLSLLAALVPSLFSIARIKRILEIFRYSKGAEQSAELPPYELLSIVVSGAARGTGCAERLFMKLGSYCKEHGISAFRIVVGDGLAPAHKFYRRMGAIEKGRIEVHEGQGSVIYIYKVI
jgi:GNAT superfamily N-acetyltransferase